MGFSHHDFGRWYHYLRHRAYNVTRGIIGRLIQSDTIDGVIHGPNDCPFQNAFVEEGFSLTPSGLYAMILKIELTRWAMIVALFL